MPYLIDLQDVTIVERPKSLILTYLFENQVRTVAVPRAAVSLVDTGFLAVQSWALKNSHLVHLAEHTEMAECQGLVWGNFQENGLLMTK